MSPRRTALLGLVVAALASCSNAKQVAQPGPTFPPAPTHSELLTKADLDPCPPTSTRSVDGGLPDVTLACLGGGPAVHLAGLSGKPAVVNIWGAWCVPCQKEARYFAAVYDDMKADVQFLGVDTEDRPDNALSFAAHVSPPMRYPSVIDDDRKVLIELHGPIGVPSTVFVAADGTVVHQATQTYASAAQLRADIKRYLGVGA